MQDAVGDEGADMQYSGGDEGDVQVAREDVGADVQDVVGNESTSVSCLTGDSHQK